MSLMPNVTTCALIHIVYTTCLHSFLAVCGCINEIEKQNWYPPGLFFNNL